MAITISGSGITSANIADGTIVNADVNDVAASKLTGALPAISGASLTGIGKIINTWQVVKTDTWSKTGWGMSEITGLSITLTPSSTSSKFLIMYRVVASSEEWKSYINLQRDAVNLFQGTAAGVRPTMTSTIATNKADSNSDGFTHHHVVHFIDEPNTTNSTRYRLEGSGRDSASPMYVNRSHPDRNYAEYDDRAASNLIIMEIAS